MKKNFFYIPFLIQFVSFGCKKSVFLGVKSDNSIAQPSTLDDYQKILDNDVVMNGGVDRQGGIDPNFLIIGADDYHVADATLASLSAEYLNLYKWQDDIYGLPISNWNQIYKALFYANVVLEGLNSLNVDGLDNNLIDKIRGSALFFRARYFYQLAQIFSPPYDASTAKSIPGVVLRLQSDINEKMKRYSLEESYAQILSDFKEAAQLLQNVSESQYKTRPCKPAAYAMLAKTYLIMHDYSQAKLYADSCLFIQNALIDFNTVSPKPTLTSSQRPIPRTNVETIFHSMLNSNIATIIGMSATARIDSNLYKSYSDVDLRKRVFFRNTAGAIYFKGSYDGSLGYFSGIAVDEIYLIRAEANARLGYIQEAMTDLNKLLLNRYETGSFTPLVASNNEEALLLVLTERRKELVQRGTRWSDLRRLNQEGAGITVTRIVNGQVYMLKPNDKRYTYLIPPDIIGFNSDMPQNLR